MTAVTHQLDCASRVVAIRAAVLVTSAHLAITRGVSALATLIGHRMNPPQWDYCVGFASQVGETCSTFVTLNTSPVS